MFLGHFVWYGESKWRDITERLHTAGGSALSSSVLRQSSPQDVTEHFYGVTLALVWHYYVQRRTSQHYDTLDITDIKDNATCCGLHGEDGGQLVKVVITLLLLIESWKFPFSLVCTSRHQVRLFWLYLPIRDSHVLSLNLSSVHQKELKSH